MSVFTRSAARTARKGARWAAVPAAAALAVLAAAGPALAAGTSLGIHTYGTVHAGHLSVSGLYQCASSAPYAELRVTADQAGPHGRVIASSTVQRVACTGATLSFGTTLAPREPHARFSTAGTRVTATIWTPGDRRGAAVAGIMLAPTAS